MDVARENCAAMGVLRRMPEEEWRALRARHAERLGPIVSAHLDRQSRGEKHPILDFLFQYYGFRSSWLLRWGPGADVLLEGEAAREFLTFEHYVEREGAVGLEPLALSDERRRGAAWILKLLETTLERAPRFGCLGLHEWAMVYRAPERRHRDTPLRMGEDALAAFVESQRIVCSHFDAFRFFTPAARPRNTLQPSREKIQDLEQRGCLHANMDLYKWATKFWPWIPSELVAETFLLAVDIRELDMRASPYDLRAYGCDPVRIETPEGQEDYQRQQMAFADRAQPLRQRLIEAYRRLIAS
ncbi:MAG: 3-methyladenine DNA glycosylase [Kiritimatiellae bacterium]|nr:3-methyladenine DNA glycosylase [Kiritimatiellia bacterium]